MGVYGDLIMVLRHSTFCLVKGDYNYMYIPGRDRIYFAKLGAL